jgi:signal transduction histidine kinase
MAALFDRAIGGLDQAQSVITALLRIGEIESGQRRAAFGPVDLNEIVGVVAELYGPIAEEKGLQFLPRADVRSTVFGDRELIIEAVANLLDNAIKFTPPGGTVRLLAENRPPGPVIRVSDTGPGIPADQRAAVMKRFYRLDKSRHVAGSGLGLSIVLAIVHLHDFDIVVGDAQPGCWFELLCYPKAAETKPVKQPADHRHLLSRRLFSWRKGANDRHRELESGMGFGAAPTTLS